jgi:hypothetical protein
MHIYVFVKEASSFIKSRIFFVFLIKRHESFFKSKESLYWMSQVTSLFIKPQIPLLKITSIPNRKTRVCKWKKWVLMKVQSLGVQSAVVEVGACVPSSLVARSLRRARVSWRRAATWARNDAFSCSRRHARHAIYKLKNTFYDHMTIWRPMWRSGVNTRLLRQRSRVRFPQGKHLCAWTCLFVLGLGVSMYNMYAFTKKSI